MLLFVVLQKKEYYRKQAKEMMAKAGVKTGSFNAFTSETRKRIQEARKDSRSHSLRSVESSPLLPLKTIGLPSEEKEKEDPKDSHSQLVTSPNAIKSDTHVSKSETIVTKPDSCVTKSETHVTKSETTVDSNRIDDLNQSNQSSLTSSTNSSHLNDGSYTPPTKEKKQFKRTPRKNKSTSDLEKNSRNQSSSLVILAPEPRRSTAAMKMAEEPPKQETEETDKPSKQQEKGEGDGVDAPAPDSLILRSRNSSMASSTEV